MNFFIMIITEQYIERGIKIIHQEIIIILKISTINIFVLLSVILRIMNKFKIF